MDALCLNMQNSYYWSDIWDKEFYIELAKKGFISTTYDTKDTLVLLPEMQFEYAVLFFENLHISKKVKKLIDSKSYFISLNSSFDEVIHLISAQHRDNWLKGRYVRLLKELFMTRRDDFKLVSVELFESKSGVLAAGEIGYIIGKTYTSLSGFSLKEKKYNNCGKLQITLFAQYLKQNGFDFWNFGHPHMSYKQNLGCITYNRADFLDMWQKSSFTNH